MMLIGSQKYLREMQLYVLLVFFKRKNNAQEEYSSLLKVTKEDVNIAFDVSIFSFTSNIT